MDNVDIHNLKCGYWKYSPRVVIYHLERHWYWVDFYWSHFVASNSISKLTFLIFGSMAQDKSGDLILTWPISPKIQNMKRLTWLEAWHIGSTHAFHGTVGKISPKLGGLGLYIRSKQRSEIELICDNRLVIYVSNL